MGFSILRFWLFIRSVFRSFFCQETSVFRFWFSLQFADFPFFSIWFSVFLKNTNGCSDLVSECCVTTFTAVTRKTKEGGYVSVAQQCTRYIYLLLT